MQGLTVRYLDDLQDYPSTLERMRQFTRERCVDTPDEIWALQHKPVFTLGQSGQRKHLLNTLDIPVVQSDRGGQVTYHGPGQLVIYTLLDIKRMGLGVRQLVSLLENAVLQFLKRYGITGYAKTDAPGVYIWKNNMEHKISALGLRVRQGRCYHGLSFNIDMNLEPFSSINPCGYEGLAVTSLAQLIDTLPDDHTLSEHLVLEIVRLLEAANA